MAIKTLAIMSMALVVLSISFTGVQAYEFSEDWETGSISSLKWATSGTNQYRTYVTTGYSPRDTYHIRMDDSRGDGTYSRNELTTKEDFSGATTMQLSFYWKEQYDESHYCPSTWNFSANGDCVAFTCDGFVWHKIIDLTGGTSSYKNEVYNISTHPNFCEEVDSSFAIKFQHYDNYPLGSDGIFLDDISVTYEIENDDSCEDSDGGIVADVFGYLTISLNGSQYNQSDYCDDGSTVMEYYCDGNYEESQLTSCGTDSYGDAYCIGDDVYKDYTDNYCSYGACDYSVTPTLQESCEYGCYGGSCNEPPADYCNETDGGMFPYTFGTAFGFFSGYSYSEPDFCVNNVTLTEFYCSGDYHYETNISCVVNGTGYCYDGKCQF